MARIFNAVRAENTPPRHARGDFKQALKEASRWEVSHDYPDLKIRLTLFHAAISEGIPQMIEHNDLRWITELPLHAFCPADEAILERLRNRLWGGDPAGRRGAHGPGAST